MKRVFTVMSTLLLMMWAGAVYADPVIITMTITKLNAQPNNFIDLTTLDLKAIINPGVNGGQNFHVGIKPGIGDLHIELPGGFIFDHAKFSQDLFSNPPRFRAGQKQNEIVDLDGGVLSFCTYFNISTTPTTSFDITPSAVPEPAGVPEPATLLLLSTGLAGVAIKTHKNSRVKKKGRHR